MKISKINSYILHIEEDEKDLLLDMLFSTNKNDLTMKEQELFKSILDVFKNYQ